MPSRKHEQTIEPFVYETAHEQVAETLRTLHISRIAEMPRVELYLDQVLSLVTMALAPLYAPDEKVVTGSMVNNYVKQHIVPAPVRKRYTRRHLASIIFVCTLKRVLPIADVTRLLHLCRESGVALEQGYDTLVEALEEALAQRFPENGRASSQPSVTLELVDDDGALVSDEVRDLLASCISLVADRVYIERTLELAERRLEAGREQAQ